MKILTVLHVFCIYDSIETNKDEENNDLKLILMLVMPRPLGLYSANFLEMLSIPLLFLTLESGLEDKSKIGSGFFPFGIKIEKKNIYNRKCFVQVQ